MADPTPPPPCAACAHQGRPSCPAGCPLAPYFPADRPERFEYANLLYGVDGILRRLEAAGPDPGTRRATMASIVFVSDARAADPVHGAYGVIRNLQQELASIKIHKKGEKRKDEKPQKRAPPLGNQATTTSPGSRTPDLGYRAAAACHRRALPRPHGKGEEARGGEALPPVATRGRRAPGSRRRLERRRCGVAGRGRRREEAERKSRRRRRGGENEREELRSGGLVAAGLK
ncbi:hypothetical protein [Oryza sativa Japonica Group]|uniref:Uncharacterized protein B1129G05.12 n=1 Tax=Oryza sativa subsp. japonica TaxID=39947 RepID=Q657B8_ORYSJ|nr:hypothetical protein [Oryza sativa Japonica Group]